MIEAPSFMEITTNDPKIGDMVARTWELRYKGWHVFWKLAGKRWTIVTFKIEPGWCPSDRKMIIKLQEVRRVQP